MSQTATEYKNEEGLYHREDGPAIIMTDDVNGRVMLEYWFLNGKRHRVDGPAVVQYSYLWSKKQPVLEEYWINDCRHREFGPARISWFYGETQVSNAFWYRYGKLHNTSGFALIDYNEDGSISSSDYYIDGNKVTSAVKQSGCEDDPDLLSFFLNML